MRRIAAEWRGWAEMRRSCCRLFETLDGGEDLSRSGGFAGDCRTPAETHLYMDSRLPYESKRAARSHESAHRFLRASAGSSCIGRVPTPCLLEPAAAGHASGCRRLRKSRVAVDYPAWSPCWFGPQI